MAKILDMPKLSPTMEEGLLTTWHKKEGDDVEVDELLAEVETDKATMEFRSFDKGTILKLLVEAGSEVKLGQPVAVLGKKGEDIDDLLAKAGGGSTKAEKAAPDAEDDEESEDESEDEESEDEDEPDETDETGDSAPAEDEESDDEEAEEKPKAKKKKSKNKDKDAAKSEKKKKKKSDADAPKSKGDAKAPEEAPAARPPAPKGSLLTRTERAGAPGPKAESGVMASPYVRRLAREQGIDLAGKRGSGPHGRLTPDDLGSLQSTPKTEASPTGTALARTPAAERADRAEKKPLSPMRKTIARRLTESKQNVPHFYLSIDVDVRALSAFRETVNEELARGFKPGDDLSAKPAKVSLNDFLIKACALALVRVPACNASFTPEALVFHHRVDVSVAVAVPDGLVTPVVRDADKKSLVAIAGEVRDLASRARSKKLAPEEMQDGTFSISNLGMFGIDSFSAVINPPEGAILAVGQVRDVPIVENGQLVAGKQLGLTLSCDHRVVDGAVGAAFLAELRALLEQPLRIVTG